VSAPNGGGTIAPSTSRQSPVLIKIDAAVIGPTKVVVTWWTDTPSDAQVEFGPTPAFGTVTALNAEQTTYHSQTLANLAPGTQYYYRVKSRNAAGKTAISTNLTFMTRPAVDLLVSRAPAPVSLSDTLAVWDGASRVSLSGRAHSATAALLWDSTYLYVSFSADASNRTPYSTTPATSGFGNDDTVEVYIDARNDTAASRPSDPYHAVVRVFHDENRVSTLRVYGTRSAVAIAIPWAEIGVTPHPGLTLGVDLVVNHGGSSIIDSYDWARLRPPGYAQPALWKRVQLAGPAPP
jgi:hypothetical protein